MNKSHDAVLREALCILMGRHRQQLADHRLTGEAVKALTAVVGDSVEGSSAHVNVDGNGLEVSSTGRAPQRHVTRTDCDATCLDCIDGGWDWAVVQQSQEKG